MSSRASLGDNPVLIWSFNSPALAGRSIYRLQAEGIRLGSSVMLFGQSAGCLEFYNKIAVLAMLEAR